MDVASLSWRASQKIMLMQLTSMGVEVTAYKTRWGEAFGALGLDGRVREVTVYLFCDSGGG
jgi:hypothetical protein